MYILLYQDARLHGSNHGGCIKKHCYVLSIIYCSRVLRVSNTCLVHLHNHLSSHLQSGSRWDLRTAEEVIGWPS